MTTTSTINTTRPKEATINTNTNTISLSPSDIVAEYLARGGDRFFAGRVREMATHAAITHGTPNGDNRKRGFEGIRVSASWPLRGSITLYRTDGEVFYLRLKGNDWLVVRKEA